jgi:hypothetical protein
MTHPGSTGTEFSLDRGHPTEQAPERTRHALARAQAHPDQHCAATNMLAAAGVALALIFGWMIIVTL